MYACGPREAVLRGEGSLEDEDLPPCGRATTARHRSDARAALPGAGARGGRCGNGGSAGAGGRGGRLTKTSEKSICATKRVSGNLNS
jgi:hypothetical protein